MIRLVLTALVSAFTALAIFPAAAQEVQINDITIGTGEEADVGMTVTVDYTGWLADGTKFDSSKDSGQPLTFTLGARQVIPGWEQGVVGMKVGGKRELTIPPELAYGSRGAGGVIPPNATLKFEVELLAVKSKSYTDLNNATLKAKLTAGVPLIDIRRPDEWRQTGVIDGSHLITFFDASGAINPNFGKELSALISGPDKEVIFICRTGHRSSTLAKYLSEKAGFTHVDSVVGGIAGWIANGDHVVPAKMPDNCWQC